MSNSVSEYRLDGIYLQRQEGFYMQRIKLPAGVISATQARTIAAVSTRFGQGTVHLTSRGSMEIHWLREADLQQVKRELAMTGLTSRGACGGAVRGISCGSHGAQGFPAIETLARRLHRHFTGNPRYEHLPKKFKIGIEADVVGGKHMIQDVGLVLSRREADRSWYDIWIAGGLGREPRAGFLFAEQVPEERLIPIIEAIVSVYTTHAPPPKRLKFLAHEFGEDRLRQLIEAEPQFNEEIPAVSGLSEYFLVETEGRQRIELPVFAGKLHASQLEQIAIIADEHADGVLMVTTNQDIAMILSHCKDAVATLQKLGQTTGLNVDKAAPVLRVCPGNHECRMGLTATRDVAQILLTHIGTQGQNLSWAISGCPNSCTQPQLVDVGIVSTTIVKGADGERTPRFDLYRREGAGLGTVAEHALTLDELCKKVSES